MFIFSAAIFVSSATDASEEARFCRVPFFSLFGAMAAALVMECHGHCLRLAAEVGGLHFQGLGALAACLRRSGRPSTRLLRRLAQLDAAAGVLRHITVVSVAELEQELVLALRSGPLVSRKTRVEEEALQAAQEVERKTQAAQEAERKQRAALEVERQKQAALEEEEEEQKAREIERQKQGGGEEEAGRTGGGGG